MVRFDLYAPLTWLLHWMKTSAGQDTVAMLNTYVVTMAIATVAPLGTPVK